MCYQNAGEMTEELKPISDFRRVLPQVLAATAKNFLLIGIGCSLTFATVVTPVLLNGKESLSMTDDQASWFGSICFIFQPIGSLLSGVIMDPIGRKRAMVLVNIPQIIAWIVMWRAENLASLFAASGLLGLSIGLMEAPVITYIGEICEPSVRGALISYSQIFYALGTFYVYLLGTVFHWRTTAAICLAVPLSTMFWILMVPESPIWLMSKGRTDDAMKSLCWLRGWVRPAYVKQEFDDLSAYSAKSVSCRTCKFSGAELTAKTQCTHEKESGWKSFATGVKELGKKETMRPLILSSLFFAFTTMTSFYSIRPNMINVFKAFNMTLDAHWATVCIGILGIAGSGLCTVLVKFTGKRALVLVSMAGSCITTFLLADYAYKNIPHDTSSYGEFVVSGEASNIPLVLFIVMIFFNSLGLAPLVWAIVSEIFPYRTRGNACGIVSAIAYILNFIATKTYLDTENSFHIYGAFYFFAAFTLVGLVYLYLALPETENRKQEEIEAVFATEKMNIFADDFVAKKIKAALERNKGSIYLENGVEGISYTSNHRINKDGFDNIGFVEHVVSNGKSFR